MLKIGEFSKIAQVSIKTLRYYDKVGLLKPVHIDRFTNYRYYTLAQLVNINQILALKDLDFSLEQIRELIKMDLTDDGLRNMLESKAAELRQHITEERARLLRVENRLLNVDQDLDAYKSPVVLKSTQNLLIAAKREVLPNDRNLQEWQHTNIKKIHAILENLKEKPSGPDLLIYHHDDFREEDIDIEIGTIIREADGNTKVRQLMDDIHLRTLSAADQLATAIAQQKATHLSDTYAMLTQWTQINGFQPIGPWRELIFSLEGQNSVPLVEVQRPVMRAAKFYQKLEINIMEPKIISKPKFSVVGLHYFGKNEHQEISELWGQFNNRMKAMGGIENDTGEAAVGLCITPEKGPEDGSFEYIAGVIVNEASDVPEGFVVRHVPSYTYAVFAHKGDLAGLKETYAYIYESWLPQSGYEVAAKLDFEYYNEDFKNFAPDSVFYIYVPIMEK